MADDTETPKPPEDNAPGEQAKDPAQQPPWERDGEDFNPEKAWNLIQNLRADNAKLRETNETNGAKLREIEDAKLTEQERLKRDLDEAQTKLNEASAAKAWAEARAKYPQLTQEDFDLIGAATPEEISAKAAKLAARIPAQDTADEAARQALHDSEMRKPLTGGLDPKGDKSRDWLRDALADK